MTNKTNAQLRADIVAAAAVMLFCVGFGGHEVVRHPQTHNAHDDLCTSAAGAMVLAGNRMAFRSNYDWVSGPDNKQEAAAGNELWRQMQLRQYLAACGMPPWIKF